MTTTITEAREAVYQQFVTTWPAALSLAAMKIGIPVPAVPYALGDETFDPPQALWVRVSAKETGSRQETLGQAGNRKFERSAAAFVQGFMPPGGDTRPLDVAMEAARLMFEGCTIGSVALRFNAVLVRELGVIESGRWQASTAECPFGYTSIK